MNSELNQEAKIGFEDIFIITHAFYRNKKQKKNKQHKISYPTTFAETKTDRFVITEVDYKFKLMSTDANLYTYLIN